MASASAEISVGFRSSAAPGTTNSASCAIRSGFAVAATPVSWAGNEASRDVADWLPRIDEPVFDARTNRFTPRWHNFFRTLGDRLGGVQGQSVPQIVQAVTETQVQVASQVAYTNELATYTEGVAATASATAEVAQTNSLSGSTSIPIPPDPPPRPGYQVP